MLEAIKNLFNKNEHLIGEILLGDEVIGSAIADLTYNEFDTNIMEARLTEVNLDQQYTFIFFQLNSATKIYFRISFDNYEKKFDLSGFSHRITGLDRTINGRINELIAIQKFPTSEDNPRLVGPRKLHIAYEFPLIKFSQHMRSGMRHIHRGYFYGDVSPGTDWLDAEMPSKWNDDIVTFHYKGKEILLYDGIVFESESKDKIGYPNIIGIHKTILSIEVMVEGDDITSEYSEIRKISNCISCCLSLFENNRINWHKEDLSLYKGTWLLENKNILRWCSPFEEEDFVGSPTFHNVQDYRDFFPKMVKALIELPEEKFAVFEEILHSFILANIPPHYELSIIYFHSCLELLRKALNYTKFKFQRGIIEGCEREGVVLSDLFSPDEIYKVKNKGKRFRFTEIRDSYLHEGLSMKRFEDVFTERPKMRALCERLILRYLDIDIQNSPMGKLRPF